METTGPHKQSETVRNDDTGVAGDAGNVHMPGIDDVKEREMKGRWKVASLQAGGDKMYQPYRMKDVDEPDRPDNREFYGLYATQAAAQMTADEFNRKAGFVKNLSTVLAEEPRSGVAYIKYDVEVAEDVEFVTIAYHDWHYAKINVTGISCGDIFREIGAEVYGAGAAGRMCGR